MLQVIRFDFEQGVNMAIIITLDIMLAKRKMKLNTLAERVGITAQNLSILKNDKARAIRFDTLNRLCKVLDCQPGDILTYEASEVGEIEE
jgi:putative transcriptional regulator